MTGPFERREGLRFPIALPVELEQGSGMTRNISASGVFFETNQVFSTGDPIRLTLVVEPTFPGIPTRLHCRGRIVRTERHEEKPGVGVAFTSYWFEPLGGGGER